MTDFGVETIHLDLPPLAAALSRRLHDAGVPMTPERPADFARALTLVRPLSRRRLYWTARSVFVSDQAHAPAFDRVFFSVFGAPAPDDPVALDERRVEEAPPDERPAVEGSTEVRTPTRSRACATPTCRSRRGSPRRSTGWPR